jgi:hypothetical protein
MLLGNMGCEQYAYRSYSRMHWLTGIRWHPVQSHYVASIYDNMRQSSTLQMAWSPSASGLQHMAFKYRYPQVLSRCVYSPGRIRLNHAGAGTAPASGSRSKVLELPMDFAPEVCFNNFSSCGMFSTAMPKVVSHKRQFGNRASC